MLGSCELMWCSSCALCSALWITRVSSANLAKGESWSSVKGIDFKLLHEQVDNEGADGGTHGCTMDLFIVLILEEEVGVFKTEFQ